MALLLDMGFITLILESNTLQANNTKMLRVSSRYKGIREAVWETYKTNRNVRGESIEAWSLHGWLSVGTHKLMQQTLKAQISRCMHPDEVSH